MSVAERDGCRDAFVRFGGGGVFVSGEMGRGDRGGCSADTLEALNDATFTFGAQGADFVCGVVENAPKVGVGVLAVSIDEPDLTVLDRVGDLLGADPAE